MNEHHKPLTAEEFQEAYRDLLDNLLLNMTKSSIADQTNISRITKDDIRFMTVHQQTGLKLYFTWKGELDKALWINLPVLEGTKEDALDLGHGFDPIIKKLRKVGARLDGDDAKELEEAVFMLASVKLFGILFVDATFNMKTAQIKILEALLEQRQ